MTASFDDKEDDPILELRESKFLEILKRGKPTPEEIIIGERDAARHKNQKVWLTTLGFVAGGIVGAGTVAPKDYWQNLFPENNDPIVSKTSDIISPDKSFPKPQR